MHTVERSVAVPYSSMDMYSLVADIDRYHEFLPWCTGSRILETKGEEVLGELHVGYGKLSAKFRTRNRNQAGEKIEMRLDSGPFHALEGNWTFTPAEKGCRVSLELRFELAGELVNKALDPLFTHEAETLVEAFRKRAVKLHGDEPARG